MIPPAARIECPLFKHPTRALPSTRIKSYFADLPAYSIYCSNPLESSESAVAAQLPLFAGTWTTLTCELLHNFEIFAAHLASCSIVNQCASAGRHFGKNIVL